MVTQVPQAFPHYFRVTNQQMKNLQNTKLFLSIKLKTLECTANNITHWRSHISNHLWTEDFWILFGISTGLILSAVRV